MKLNFNVQVQSVEMVQSIRPPYRVTAKGQDRNGSATFEVSDADAYRCGMVLSVSITDPKADVRQEEKSNG